MTGVIVRPLRFAEGVAFVPLTQGMEAIIDIEDAALVSGANWYAVRDQQKFYAQRKIRVDGTRKTLKLHRLVSAVEASVFVDHINGDGLDCRRANLRAATCAQNLWNVGRRANNTSGFKGVNWHPTSQMWQAQIVFNKTRKHLGSFKKKEDAHKAYQDAAKRYHGEFARQ